MLNRGTYHYKGSGNGVAIVMDTHGIGDDIMMIHALRELAKREKVTVFCKEFTKEIFENVGCEVYPSVNEGGKTIFSGLYDATGFNGERSVISLSAEFSDIYSLNSWSTFEYDRTGEMTMTPLRLICEILQVPFVPMQPYEYTYYLPYVRRDGDYTLFAPDSTNNFRSIQKQKKLERELKKQGNVVTIGRDSDYAFERSGSFFDFVKVSFLNSFYSKRKSDKIECTSLRELVSYVYNAKNVVTSDNGIMNIACCLGIDTKVALGFSGDYIVNQWNEMSTANRYIIRSEVKGCSSPCNGQNKNGFSYYGENGLCQHKSFTPKCQTAISITLFRNEYGTA